MEPLIPFAIQKESGQLAFIDDVPSGSACNCICISCGVPLVAKKGPVNVHHFSHEAQSVNDDKLCEFSVERAIYLMISQILGEEGCLLVPNYEFKLSKPLLDVMVETLLVTKSLVSVKLLENNNYKETLNERNSLLLGTSEGIFALTVVMETKKHYSDYNFIQPELVNNRRVPHLVVNLSGLVQKFLNYKRGYKNILQEILLESTECKNWIYHPGEESLRADFKKQVSKASFASIRPATAKKTVKKNVNRSASSPNTLDFKAAETESRLNELIEQVNKIVSLGFLEGERCQSCYFMNKPGTEECFFCSHNEFEHTIIDENYLYCIENKYSCWLYPMYSLQAISKIDN